MTEIVKNGAPKIALMCVNHPELRWETKNIDFIGARRIFFVGDTIGTPRWEVQECECPGSLLEPVFATPEDEQNYYLDPNEGESFEDGTADDTWEWGDEHLYDTPPRWAVKVKGRRAARFQ